MESSIDTSKCKVCNSVIDGPLYRVKEMQLGLRDEFNYELCNNCGCLQLTNAPSDFSKYYPNENYYSFTSELAVRPKPDPLRKIRTSYLAHNKNKILGSLLSVGYKVPEYITWLKIADIGFKDKILDVGTGNGSLLLNLFKNGFTELTGVDPFIDADKIYGSINIFKKGVFQIKGQYDFIMLNHVFEHMDEPLKVLKQLYTLLKPKKYLLIRTPLMGTYAWQKYKESWMQIDAPRHIIVHTKKSMELLASQAGFVIDKIIYDSITDTLIGSEQYQKNIALRDPDSYFVNKEKSIFTEQRIEDIKKLVPQLNATGQADQAGYFLYKP